LIGGPIPLINALPKAVITGGGSPGQVPINTAAPGLAPFALVLAAGTDTALLTAGQITTLDAWVAAIEAFLSGKAFSSALYSISIICPGVVTQARLYMGPAADGIGITPFYTNQNTTFNGSNQSVQVFLPYAQLKLLRVSSLAGQTLTIVVSSYIAFSDVKP